VTLDATALIARINSVAVLVDNVPLGARVGLEDFGALQALPRDLAVGVLHSRHGQGPVCNKSEPCLAQTSDTE
jgi:hypothetical protein